MKENFQCHAKRHMDAEYRVYDTMLAMARKGWNEAKAAGSWPDGRKWNESDPLICYAKVYTLANMIDRSTEQVNEAISKLEGKWAIPTTDQQRRKGRGQFTTYEYRMVEHDEYSAAHPEDCPTLRYDPETGEKLKAGRLAKGLERQWIHKLIGAVLPNTWTDAIASAMRAKKEGTVTGNPVTVGTYPYITPEQVLAERRTQEILRRTDTGNPVTVDTGNPASDGHRKSCDKLVTHLKPEGSAREEAKPESALPQNVRTESSALVGSSSFQRHEDEETVLQHFDDFPVFSTLAEVTGERLNLRTNEWSEFGTDNQYKLLRVCNQVLAEIVKEPWAGDATLARVMDQAATRFIRSNGNVPKSWLKVRSDLRDGKANTTGT
jgi:hypothetical protein